MFEDGNAKLREQIKTKWLSEIGGHASIYENFARK